MKRDGKAPSRRRFDTATTVGFVAVALFFVASGAYSYYNVQVLNRDSRLVAETHDTISAFDDLLSTLKDAETGQRGYVITGQDRYLEPYSAARARLEDRLDELVRLTKDRPQAQRVPQIRQRIEAKMAELADTIELRRTKGFDAARSVILTDRGLSEMDALRNQVSQADQEERALREQRLDEMENANRTAVASGVLTSLIGLLLSILIARLIRRSMGERLREEWLQTGQVGLAEAMFGDKRIEALGDGVLRFLAEYLDAHAGAFYVEENGRFRRVATYGLPAEGESPDGFAPGERLLGRAVLDKRAFVVRDLPEGYLTVSSGLGKSEPRQILVAPAIVDGEVNGVFELGFIHPLSELATEFIDRIDDAIGIAVRSANDRARLQDLLEETQRQSEELQTQSEELRVSNEELEEQSRALKDSQARLEQQQVELEQTNAQLEEQAQQLENQRDNLVQARLELEDKAKDLERTSRFKSDFLANMSHELRTPLNSSLILAKLLSENREGNLTDEQVRYAQTIGAAGNDLLNLIGDILDLSKIEAGHMEVQMEPLNVTNALENLRRTFEPLAAQKSLTLETRVLPGTPATIVSDGQRLEQILKNLISNAIKFTETGGVAVEVSRAADGRVAFAVVDTGIGISDEQREIVFEAFRQADGTTNRKYGGTGLGLSISRELAHLLGGEITLASEVGKGSAFTVSIPENGVQTPASKPAEPAARAPEPIEIRPAPKARDDRDRVSSNDRLVLVVEDDLPFARILCDLAHEYRFQCLIATSAEEGLDLAMRHLPSAVLLDIGLPDNSGLSVLDRLKHEDRTRHIPVHVVSGSDHERTAKALGAVGYLLKPVKREEVEKAFADVERMLTQRLRRVLVVEDDPVQLDSLRLLLGSREVETVGASSAADCLALLSATTFDCMVLDLSLPDASGFTLLETLSQNDAYAFPPVIVYTGRELTQDEEQRLRRYSKSIIVKGAKSPERLLDEVTLFLHQVVAELPPDQRRLIEKAKHRDAALEERNILIVEDDVRNVFALTSILEPRGAHVEIARNGREAIDALERRQSAGAKPVDLVLMDVMMPEMDGLTAMREIRKNPEWKRLPIIALTAKAMKNDQEECLAAGANDYVAKPLDVDKLLSLVRVWMPRD